MDYRSFNNLGISIFIQFSISASLPATKFLLGNKLHETRISKVVEGKVAVCKLAKIVRVRQYFTNIKMFFQALNFHEKLNIIVTFYLTTKKRFLYFINYNEKYFAKIYQLIGIGIFHFGK